ncbi:hypothetical protein [Caulobacter endophyticus]|uniref:Penicillin-insensitive murein endopeptidase n=1 Tax=Caulobacter endophyticus TaxID=2172652 RepID=A0A2T9JE91_9CAUL|nr:hypothetical protein [Caulobacter endophyticus]PVM82022.1 hypothetical protein DDF67_23685 [Caulobacter endophyticus]
MSTSWRRGAKLVALLGGAVILTILTQVGGLVLLATAWIAKLRRWPAWLAILGFVAVYSLTVGVVVPPLAKLGGRERLPCFVGKATTYGAVSPLLCVLSRNYARPEARAVVASLANHMAKAYPGTITRYLDASFPFFDGFPLPPHLSHRDGLKIDLAYFYREQSGAPVIDGAASPIGYWAYEGPKAGEALPCAGYRRANLRWDFNTLQPLATRTADPVRTAAMLRWLSTEGRALGVKKILLEPHLKARWAQDVDMIRFQGCRAARHDDHLHLELSKKN